MNDVKTASLDAFYIDRIKLDGIINDYKVNGDGGPLRLVMAYTEKDNADRADAERRGRIYKETFAAQGVPGVDVDYVPVQDKQLRNHAVLSYTALQALPPEDCRSMTGYHGADTLEDVSTYSFGCETKSALSQMIVRPADLVGSSGLPDSESRRQGALVERFMSGQPNERMEGLGASEVGN